MGLYWWKPVFFWSIAFHCDLFIDLYAKSAHLSCDEWVSEFCCFVYLYYSKESWIGESFLPLLDVYISSRRSIVGKQYLLNFVPKPTKGRQGSQYLYLIIIILKGGFFLPSNFRPLPCLSYNANFRPPPQHAFRMLLVTSALMGLLPRAALLMSLHINAAQLRLSSFPQAKAHTEQQYYPIIS